MPPMPHNVMPCPTNGAAAAPVMPLRASTCPSMVGSQIWLVQIASSVPTQNSTPMKVL